MPRTPKVMVKVGGSWSLNGVIGKSTEVGVEIWLRVFGVEWVRRELGVGETRWGRMVLKVVVLNMVTAIDGQACQGRDRSVHAWMINLV